MNLHFANPHWAHLLWPILAATTVGLWLQVRQSSRLERFMSRVMQQRLVSRPPLRRRLLATALLAIAAVALTGAMMRPQWGRRYVETRRMGAEIMVCLDVSKSMLAEDVAPNRLERAKAEIADLVSMMDADHIGLIAFAGKATVLSPMTTDHGFLKLVLAQAGPHSVARGGTNLEAPLRKALAGFRTEADISRVILMITDGEDHDSFCVDAAKATAERGVRVIAIGLGEETGSEIVVTDPDTHIRKAVLDATGKPVISRLDGDLLREIALTTEGAYVPAGTGALDLRSIYDSHIAPLMRAELTGKGRLIANEAFQWFVLAAIVAVALAGLCAGGARRVGAISPAAIAVALVLSVSQPARAQEPTTQPTSQPATQPAQTIDDPRELYNHGLSLLNAGDTDGAEQALLDARSRAGVDGEMRYRATFNLAWVHVARADATVTDAPAKALEHLQSAALWFGEAARLRDSDEPRRNLELISRRIVELTDALREKEQTDLTAQLDALIKAQRGRLGELGTMVQLTADRPGQTESLRRPFRQLGLAQRQTLAELLDVTDLAGRELDSIESTEPDQRTPEQAMRKAQLESVLAWCERASQRAGQARSRLRRRQAERAWRRASASLDLLKRARDQLRDPGEILRALLTDTGTLLTHTAGLAQTHRPALKTGDAGPHAPAWLTEAYLTQSQQQLTERTDELHQRLSAAVEQMNAQAATTQSADAQQAKARRILADVVPLTGKAVESFRKADDALARSDLNTTAEAQADAGEALARAAEMFLDLRGLIEAMYADAKRTQAVLADDEAEAAEYAPMLAKLNAMNLDRAARLAAMLDEPAADPQADQAQQEAAAQRTELARQLLAQLTQRWEGSAEVLTGGNTQPAQLRPAADASVEDLEALRRLYFTLIEHLRDTLARQVDLNDRTQTAGDEPDANRARQSAAPLAGEQQSLAQITEQIGQALREQSQQGPAQGAQANAQAGEQLAKAAEKVDAGRQAMGTAAGEIQSQVDATTDPIDLQTARTAQDAAAERLAEAIALLQPPKDQNKQDQNQQQKQQQAQPQQGENEKKSQTQQRQTDVEGMLQAIRDRQQQRQKRNQRRPAGYAPVEKDW